MLLTSSLGALLRAPLGNNLENNPDDITNTKKNFGSLGYYKNEDQNGYLDQELHDSIFAFQKDHNLKVDGIMNPGGETEAMMVSQKLKLPVVEPKINGENIHQASAGAIPLLGAVGLGLGMTIQGATEWWTKQHPYERDNIARSLDYILNHNKAGATEPDKLRCDLEFDENTKRCSEITLRYGHDAGRICHETAKAQYAQCLSGLPVEDRRRLQRP